MDCRQFQDLVAAHVDGHLTGDERRRAEEHFSACGSCQALGRAQVDVKRLLHEHRQAQPAPELLRAAIKRRIAGTERAQKTTKKTPTTRTRVLMAGAIAATVLLSLLPSFHTDETSIIQLLAADVAQAEAIPPEVRTASTTDLRSYYAGNGLDFESSVDNLEPFGFHLLGGSVSRLGDRPTTLTIYESGGDRLLCRRFRAEGFRWPEGGRRIGNSHVFSHDGVYVSLKRLSGDVICAMTSRMPPERFVTALHRDH